MELPQELLSILNFENNIYFFKENCPIGIPNHMHICIKQKDRILLFSTCTSQIDTVYRLAMRRGTDPNTFPCFKKNESNQFDRDLTFVNCNNITECSLEDFNKLVSEKKIICLDGVITDYEMQLIVNGVKLSKTVPMKIKEMFK